MANYTTGQPRSPITIYETEVYRKTSALFLNDYEVVAIRFLLADNPSIGNPHPELGEAFLALDWSGNKLEVIYAFSPAGEIFLIEVGPKSEQATMSAEFNDKVDSKVYSDLMGLAKKLIKSGIIVGGFKKLWEVLKELADSI